MNPLRKIIREALNNQTLKLQRAQINPATDNWDLNVSNGQHGEGVYAFAYGDRPMIDYYTKNGETLYTFTVPRQYVKDMSNKNWDYWEAKQFIYNNPQYKVFIFRHAGPGIPTSKEFLITDPDIITLA